MITVGIVGAGTMGLFHTNGYKEIERAEVRGICDVEKPRARKFGEQHGIRFYQSLEEMLQDQHIEVIDICTPTPTHKEIFLRAIEAGKHVFCEKPLARTLAEGEEILRACRNGNKKYSVGHVLRFFQEYEAIRNLLDAGEIGTPRIARACRCVELPPTGPAWFFDLDASGGAILDLIIHDFDFLLWSFGEVERVFAKGLYASADMPGGVRVDSTAIFASEEPTAQANARSGVPGKDYALVTLAFKNGVIAHVEGSWVYPGGFYMSLEVAGSEGLLRYDSRRAAPLKVLLTSAARKEANEGVEVPESPVKDSPYTRELRAFVNSCLNDTQPEISVEHALESLRVCDAAFRSIISGKPVEL